MILRRDTFNIRTTNNRLAKFWAGSRFQFIMLGVGLKSPIQLLHNQEELLTLNREGKLLWKGDHWSLHITVMREAQIDGSSGPPSPSSPSPPSPSSPPPPSTLLAVDLRTLYSNICRVC
ncbi:MAG: hypothetical protein ACK4FV_01060 [Candidatus Nitrosocaldus sp.]